MYPPKNPPPPVTSACIALRSLASPGYKFRMKQLRLGKDAHRDPFTQPVAVDFGVVAYVDENFEEFHPVATDRTWNDAGGESVEIGKRSASRVACDVHIR